MLLGSAGSKNAGYARGSLLSHPRMGVERKERPQMVDTEVRMRLGSGFGGY